jgi:hypothetical protein
MAMSPEKDFSALFKHINREMFKAKSPSAMTPLAGAPPPRFSLVGLIQILVVPFGAKGWEAGLGLAMLITTTEFANRVGISQPAIAKAIRVGRH